MSILYLLDKLVTSSEGKQIFTSKLIYGGQNIDSIFHKEFSEDYKIEIINFQTLKKLRSLNSYSSNNFIM